MLRWVLDCTAETQVRFMSRISFSTNLLLAKNLPADSKIPNGASCPQRLLCRPLTSQGSLSTRVAKVRGLYLYIHTHRIRPFGSSACPPKNLASIRQNLRVLLLTCLQGYVEGEHRVRIRRVHVRQPRLQKRIQLLQRFEQFQPRLRHLQCVPSVETFQHEAGSSSVCAVRERQADHVLQLHHCQGFHTGCRSWRCRSVVQPCGVLLVVEMSQTS